MFLLFFSGVCEGIELLEWLVFFLRSFVARGLRLWKRGKLLLFLSPPAAILLRGGTSAVAAVGLLFAAAALVYYTSLPPIDSGAKRSGRERYSRRRHQGASAHLLPPLSTHTLIHPSSLQMQR